MKNRILSVLLALCLAISAFGLLAGAVETDSGSCGEGLTWTYSDGVLTVSGSGAMEDFEDGAPWAAYKDQIKGVTLTGGVTYVGAYAFANYDNLEAVELGSALTELGKAAFKDCDGLTSISLPKSFRTLGEESLQSCGGLEAIYCAGSCPSFKMNCLWDTYVTIYYPADRPWSAATIESLTTAFKGRVTYLPTDGSEPATEPEETTVPEDTTLPEETTVPTKPEETTAPTEPEETTAPTEPEETTAPTEPEQTEPPTGPTPPTDGKDDGDGRKSGWIWLVIAAAALVAVFVIMIFALRPRKPKYRGKYSRRRR